MIRKGLLSATGIATFFISVSAAGSPIQPVKCPSVSAIQQVSFVNVVQDRAGNDEWRWGGYQRNNTYDTDVKWDFTIGAVDATDINDATNKLTAALPTLQLWLGPIGDEEMWECMYNSPLEHIGAIAFSPPEANKIGAHLKLITQGFK